MLEAQDPIELEEIQDAIGECANMLTGTLKTNVLDPSGAFTLGIPKVEAFTNREPVNCRGSLVYKLSEGHAEIEIWQAMSESGA